MPLLTRRLLTVALLWTALAATAGELVTRMRVQSLAQTARTDVSDQAARAARALDDQFSTIEGLAVAVAQFPRVREILRGNPGPALLAIRDSVTRREKLTAREDVKVISEQLQPINAAVSSLGALYIIDNGAFVIASSDYEDPSSRLGRVHPFRDTFARLRFQRVVSGYAPSATSGRPGWIVAAAVLDGTRVIGGAAAHIEADSISHLLASSEANTVFLADTTGQVLAASDSKLVLHPAPADTTAEAAVWVRTPMKHYGLSLHMKRALPQVAEEARDTRIIAALIWLGGLILLGTRERAKRQLAAIEGAERAAKGEQARVRDMLNASYDAVVTMDMQHRVVDWNARAETLFGYAASEMVGGDLTQKIIPERWRQQHAAGFAAATRIGRSDVFGKPRELSALNRRGEEFPIELTMSPAKDAAGNTLFIAFFRDIRDRKADEAARAATERALNEARARMELVLRRSPIAQLVWDEESGLVFANPATLKLFGYADESALIGKRPWDIASPSKGKAAVDEVMARLAREGQTTFEWVHRRADGSEFPSSITLVDLPRVDGRHQYISTIIDQSESKAAEAAIIAAKEAAEQAEAAKSAFLATMSHEIRTPMNGVMSMAEMLDQTDLDDDQRGMLQVVRSSADALLTIINDILDVSKIEAGKMTLEDVAMSPAEIVEDVAQLLAGRAQEKKVGLYAEVDSSVPSSMLGDPTRIRQIVVNLAGNALKFTEAGFVRIRATMAKSRLRLEISDTGIGLTAEQRGRLFQPFMQADSSTARKFGGTGLGLSICRRLVELMGGEIGVDSIFGSGSTFWCELPLRTLAPAAAPEVAISDVDVMLAGFPREQARILESYVVAAGAPAPIYCVKANDAIAKLGGDPSLRPVVVLPTYPADHPGGGLQIARAIRELPDRGETPVCLIVPSTLISSASAAAQTGFIATTTEPVRRERFWRMLAVAVGRAKAERRQRPASANVRYDSPVPDAAAAKGALVLVAEDNRTNQIVIGRVLSDMGIAHVIVDNGAVALRRLKAERAKFGLLLSDFHMPEMDGFELTRAWRDLERKGAVTGRLPILALTADALAGMDERCREAGMDGYLTKPIVRDRLNEELERWLPVAFELRTAAKSPEPRRSKATASVDDTPPPAAPSAIDLAAFAAQIGIEPGPEARELVVSLWESVSGLAANLDAAFASHDRNALRDAAHAGKGAAHAIGARTLGELCSALQDEAQQLAWDALEDRLGAAKAEHQRVRDAIAALASV